MEHFPLIIHPSTTGKIVVRNDAKPNDVRTFDARISAALPADIFQARPQSKYQRYSDDYAGPVYEGLMPGWTLVSCDITDA